MAEQVRRFRYPGPADPDARDRGPTRGRSSDLLYNHMVISTVQVMEKGQTTGLHHHNDQDGYWMVLGGKARFSGEGDTHYGDLGPMEGIFMPRYTRYSFESIDDEPLQILRVSQLRPVEGKAQARESDIRNEVKRFSYPGAADPGARDRGPDKGRSYDLLYNDSMVSTVQIMGKGQGNALHYHNDQDGYWMVLDGWARYFGEGGTHYGDLGPMEGIYTPRYTRYGFECISDEPLQILRVSQLRPVEGKPRPRGRRGSPGIAVT